MNANPPGGSHSESLRGRFCKCGHQYSVHEDGYCPHCPEITNRFGKPATKFCFVPPEEGDNGE